MKISLKKFLLMVKTSLKKFFNDGEDIFEEVLMTVKTSLKKFLMMVKILLYLKLFSDKIFGLKGFVEIKQRSYLVIKAKEVK